MYFITESLLIGNVHDAQKLPPTVSALLWAAGDLCIQPPSNIPFAVIPLKEYQEADPIDMEAGVDWLARRPASEQTLVCCREGLGRSVSLVIAYLCCVKSLSYDEAYKLLAARRPGATPLPNLKNTIEAVRRLRKSSEVAGP